MKMDCWLHFHIRTALLALFIVILFLVRCAATDLARSIEDPAQDAAKVAVIR